MLKPGEIKVKNNDVLHALLTHVYDPKLIEIIDYIINNWGLMITEGWRPARHPGDVHCTDPCRAVDIRSWTYSQSTIDEIVRDVNQRWQYDPQRPEKKCVLYHRVKSGSLHCHIQVHPHTIRASIL